MELSIPNAFRVVKMGLAAGNVEATIKVLDDLIDQAETMQSQLEATPDSAAYRKAFEAMRTALVRRTLYEKYTEDGPLCVTDIVTLRQQWGLPESKMIAEGLHEQEIAALKLAEEAKETP